MNDTTNSKSNSSNSGLSDEQMEMLAYALSTREGAKIARACSGLPACIKDALLATAQQESDIILELDLDSAHKNADGEEIIDADLYSEIVGMAIDLKARHDAIKEKVFDLLDRAEFRERAYDIIGHKYAGTEGSSNAVIALALENAGHLGLENYDGMNAQEIADDLFADAISETDDIRNALDETANQEIRAKIAHDITTALGQHHKLWTNANCDRYYSYLEEYFEISEEMAVRVCNASIQTDSYDEAVQAAVVEILQEAGINSTAPYADD